MTNRNPSLDVARGIAIVLIVLGHVTRGLSGAGIVNPWAPWYEELDTAIYLVHLAVFFLISGLFVGRAATRDGASRYLANRLVLLGYLFVLWTAVQGLVKVATGSLANTPVTAGSIVSELWRPNSQLWFLPSLAIMTVLAVALAPWRNGGRALVTLLLAASISVLAWGISGHWSFTMGMGLLVFFAAGNALGAPRVTEWLRTRKALIVGLLGGLVYVTLLWLTDPTPPSTMFWPRATGTVAAGVVAAVGGTCAVLVLSRVLADTVTGRPLAFLGRRSLEIFLAHIIFASGIRIALQQMGISDPGVHIAAGVLAGVALPIVLAITLERLHLPWLFRPPAWIQVGPAQPNVKAQGAG